MKIKLDLTPEQFGQLQKYICRDSNHYLPPGSILSQTRLKVGVIGIDKAVMLPGVHGGRGVGKDPKQIYKGVEIDIGDRALDQEEFNDLMKIL